MEEDEENETPMQARPARPGRPGKLRLVDPADHKNAISYSQMSLEDKENVLTDLLVKSVINHALEKQKQVVI